MGRCKGKFRSDICITVIFLAVVAAICTIWGGGSVERAVIILLLAANVGAMHALIALSKNDTAQQTQIDDLQRELEEVKRKLEG